MNDLTPNNDLASQYRSISNRILILENTERLGPEGQRRLSDAINERTRIGALLNAQENSDVRAALHRIGRKADIMRLDARARGDHSVVADANEISLLVEIMLRAIECGE